MNMTFTIKKPIQLSWISKESWERLKLKEKDFMIFVSDRKYTKKQIMRKLYITNYSSYWRMQKSIESTLSVDIAKRNEIFEKVLIDLKKG